MRAAEVARSGIMGVFGVSRRDVAGADGAGATSFVDNEDILLRPGACQSIRAFPLFYIAVWKAQQQCGDYLTPR
jgi:hypothetical protein